MAVWILTLNGGWLGFAVFVRGANQRPIEFPIDSACVSSECRKKESKRSLCHWSLLYCIDWTFIKQIFDFTTCDQSSLNWTKQKERTTTCTVRNKNNYNFLREETVWCPLSVLVSDQFYISKAHFFKVVLVNFSNF